MSAADPLIKKKLMGKYLIERKIGSGGFGTVYQAMDPMKRLVTVKILHAPSQFAAGEHKEAIERFKQEAEAIAKIPQNRQVIQVYDSGYDETLELYFIVMEYFDGVSLKDLLEEEEYGGQLPLELAQEIELKCLRGLQQVHMSGIIHRDLKPSNILLKIRDGQLAQLKIIDFGISRPAEDDGAGLTATGSAVGTPCYMAPEQFMSQADLRSDLYALSVIFYEMITGVRPFDGTIMEIINAHGQKRDPPTMHRHLGRGGQVSKDLNAFVQRGLKKDPNDRFTDAEEMYESLRSCRLEPRPMFRSLGIATGVMALLAVALFAGQGMLRNGFAILNGPARASAVEAPQGPPPLPEMARAGAPRMVETSSAPKAPERSVPEARNEAINRFNIDHDYAAALLVLEPLWAQHPEEVELLYDIGSVYALKQENDKAEKAFEAYNAAPGYRNQMHKTRVDDWLSWFKTQ